MVDSLSGLDTFSRTAAAVMGPWRQTSCMTSRSRSPRSGRASLTQHLHVYVTYRSTVVGGCLLFLGGASVPVGLSPAGGRGFSPSLAFLESYSTSKAK